MRSTSKSFSRINGVAYIECDISNVERLKEIILNVDPDEIYNLAAQTNAVVSIAEPEESLWLNGNVVMSICEAMRNMKKPVKLFQANSSELYKGIDIGKVDESFLSFYPKHPYGIGKLASYWCVRYYREQYNLYTCNGIIFNTESPRRKATYVTSKIVREIRKIINEEVDALAVGNIDSYRDWIHAYDVALAAWNTLQYEKADDYIISLGQSHTVRYFIEQAFSMVGIEIEWVGGRGTLEEKGVDKKTKKILVRINSDFFRHYEKTHISLVGDNTKLKSIGWMPTYTLDDIIYDMTHNMS